MIHPMWHDYAKVALREYLRADDSEDLNSDGFDEWTSDLADNAARVADAMCGEYDRRNASKAPTGSSYRDNDNGSTVNETMISALAPILAEIHCGDAWADMDDLARAHEEAGMRNAIRNGNGGPRKRDMIRAAIAGWSAA